MGNVETDFFYFNSANLKMSRHFTITQAENINNSRKQCLMLLLILLLICTGFILISALTNVFGGSSVEVLSITAIIGGLLVVFICIWGCRAQAVNGQRNGGHEEMRERIDSGT